MSDDLKDLVAQATERAMNHPAGTALAIAHGYWPEITAKGYLKVCPFCQGKGNKIRFKPRSWGCYSADCEANHDRLAAENLNGPIGLLMMKEGLDRTAARRRLYAITGTPDPYEEHARRRESRPTPKAERKDSEPAAEEPPAPEKPEPPARPAITLQEEEMPEEPATTAPGDVWEAIVSRLSLSVNDREALKRARGFSKETIDTLRFCSASADNKAKLQPILSLFPLEVLFKEGIAVKDRESEEIKLNSQLYGWGLKQRGGDGKKEKWDWTHPILIPYLNGSGKAIGLRPHKGGLSGKAWMREQGFEFAFRSARTRTHPYTTPLFWNRPEEWRESCVLTEGEFKAAALHQCGIPAIAVPGIQMPRNEIFLEELVETLRLAGIREVIVVFDSEDKTHKPDPWTRYDVDVYQLYACHALRTHGFNTRHTCLPDEWRVAGKADWDGALAQLKGKAPAQFRSILRKSPRYYPQAELFSSNEKDRIVHCKLNRLIHKPHIFTGGDQEEELAKLILRAADPFRDTLRVRDLAQALFETRGCYYIPVKPTKDALNGKKGEDGYYTIAAQIRADLRACPAEDVERTAQLEAALAAVNHCIAGTPKLLSDFTIHCEYQLRTQEGEVKRLFQIRNKHGQVSDHLAIDADSLSTSTKFRAFMYAQGNFNPMFGDKELQLLNQDIGVMSAWREIRELETLGRDKDSDLWIFGDCAIHRKTGEVIFADDHDILWHEGIGYRLDPESLESFAHKEPPMFFQALGKQPSEVLREIRENPEAEEVEVAKIFTQLSADMIATFGDSSGLLILGAMLTYAMAPELLHTYKAHPGAWIHGRAFAGKTETLRFLMQMWGYSPEYRNISLSTGSTNVGIDRPLAQYSDIPLHLDEFRQDEADKARISTLRMAYGRQAKSKGRLDQTNRTRSVQPMTSPIVTGEGVTNDSATLSRYVEAILAKDKRLGTPEQQRSRYKRMLDREARNYHRIIRYILMRGPWFGQTAFQTLEDFVADSTVSETITSDRLRITYGSAYAAYAAFHQHCDNILCVLGESGKLDGWTISSEDFDLVTNHSNHLRDYTIRYAANASADVASINFVVKFWSDIMNLYQNEGSIRRFLRFEWAHIDPDNRVTLLAGVPPGGADGAIPVILVISGPLYAHYEKDARSRGHTPELSLTNIKAEASHERYWVPHPKKGSYRGHRFRFDFGDQKIQKPCWVLRLDRMEPAMASLFEEHFSIEDDQDRMDL